MRTPVIAPSYKGFTRIALRWFRDVGNGQAACDAMKDKGSIESADGVWPIALLPCDNDKHATELWQLLYYSFGVNATTYYT